MCDRPWCRSPTLILRRWLLPTTRSSLDVASDLAPWINLRVHVHVGCASPYCAQELGEVAGVHALFGRADHIGRNDCASRLPGGWAVGLATAPAKKGCNAAIHIILANMDVRE